MRPTSNYSILLKHGIKIYPVYQERDLKVKGIVVYHANNWYIEADNNGKITRYQKSIQIGKILYNKNWTEKAKITMDHWVKKIKKQLK